MTNGWGGYHDAGDWNPRRVTHMRATLAQLEIADLFPEYVAKVKLNIPQDYKVPDLFNEALFSDRLFPLCQFLFHRRHVLRRRVLVLFAEQPQQGAVEVLGQVEDGADLQGVDRPGAA